MNKEDFLKSIAERGYDVGFGAKKHFATFDIIEKIPGWIGFLSISFGIISLAVNEIESKLVSAIFVILGVASLHVGFYSHNKENYSKSGEALTKIFYQLKHLYLTAKGSENSEVLATCQQEFEKIQESIFTNSISKQIFFSNWYAHYKFFWELQIGWIDEQLKFRFFRDKIPLSLSLCAIALVICIVILGLCALTNFYAE